MTKCRFISDMWIHRKTALEVTCIFENLKVVLMWCERCAYNVNELVDTSCVALCIWSESVLPCICLPLAADSYRCVGSVMWNMLELLMFGQSGNRVCQGVGLWQPFFFFLSLFLFPSCATCVTFNVYQVCSWWIFVLFSDCVLCEVLMRWNVVRWSWKSVMSSVRTNIYVQVYFIIFGWNMHW